MPTTDTSGWGDIINAALAIYSIKQGQKAPNFYPVPPSPSEVWKNDQTKNLYNFGAGYTEQYLKGLGNMNPDFQMPNSLTGNPSFMGGVKVPSIDFSKLTSPTGAAPIATATPASTTPTSVPTSSGVGTGPDQPLGGSGDPFKDLPSGTTPEQNTGLHQIWDWLQQHPNVARGGADVVAAALGLIGGPMGALIGTIGDKLFKQWFNNAAPFLPIKKSDIDPADLTPAGGSGVLPTKNIPINPADLTPGGQPTRVKIDPSTGMWTMDKPSSTEQAWLNSINNFNNNLMNGPGQSGPPTPGPSSYGGGDSGGFWDWYNGYLGGGRQKP